MSKKGKNKISERSSSPSSPIEEQPISSGWAAPGWGALGSSDEDDEPLPSSQGFSPPQPKSPTYHTPGATSPYPSADQGARSGKGRGKGKDKASPKEKAMPASEFAPAGVDSVREVWPARITHRRVGPPLNSAEKQQRATPDRAEDQKSSDQPTRNAGSEPPAVGEEPPGCGYGVRLRLHPGEIHFGNPRCRVTNKDPATMPVMLKWTADKFDGFEIECAQVCFGRGFQAWCAQGARSNRLLYAMKRCEVNEVKVITVPAPPPPADDDDEEVTYGTECTGIQLVP